MGTNFRGVIGMAFIELNGINVHYNLVNEQAQDTLVLLHGFTGSTSTWDEVLANFPKALKIVTVDLIGHGLTDAPANLVPYSMQAQIKLLDDLFDEYYDPQYPEIYLTNVDLEILGRISYPDEMGDWSEGVLPMPDQGCVVLTDRDVLHGGPEHIRVRRFSREDFNPIPCGVSKIPKEQIEALAFPNPTSGQLNIDISSVPYKESNKIRIIDQKGSLLMDRIIRQAGNLLTLDVSSLPSGIYFYQIYNTENELLKGKFIKE